MLHECQFPLDYCAALNAHADAQSRLIFRNAQSKPDNKTITVDIEVSQIVRDFIHNVLVGVR